MATHHLITLLRSPIGLPPASRQTLVALGLHRRHQAVLHPFSATVAGQVLRVKELVSVRNVGADDGARAVRRRRPEGSGWEVLGRVGR
ncbi:hypothetical protein Q5752_001379 [Cryptotrichosporon argae]